MSYLICLLSLLLPVVQSIRDEHGSPFFLIENNSHASLRRSAPPPHRVSNFVHASPSRHHLDGVPHAHVLVRSVRAGDYAIPPPPPLQNPYGSPTAATYAPQIPPLSGAQPPHPILPSQAVSQNGQVHNYGIQNQNAGVLNAGQQSENAGQQNSGSQTAGGASGGTQTSGAQNFVGQNAISQNAGVQSSGAGNSVIQNAGAQSAGAQSPGAQNVGAAGGGAQNVASQNAGTQSSGAQTAGSQNTGAENSVTQNAGAGSGGVPGGAAPNAGAGAQNAGVETAGAQEVGIFFSNKLGRRARETEFDNSPAPMSSDITDYNFPERKPLPKGCFYNKSGYACCNQLLNDAIVREYNKLAADPKFNNCNTQRIANSLSRTTEKEFSVSMETVVGLADYAQRLRFKGSFICKLEMNGRYMTVYGTPVKSARVRRNATLTHDHGDFAHDSITEMLI